MGTVIVMPVARIVVIALLLAGLNVQSQAQDLRPWKHGVIEPKGDAGFMVMVGQREFASKHGLKVEIVALKNGATAHKALLAGELDSNQAQTGAANLPGAPGAAHKNSWGGVPRRPPGLMVRTPPNQGHGLQRNTARATG